MKILTLHGSGRKKGNTAKVLTWVEDELRAQGHEVERVFLAYKEIKGCLGCAKCKNVPDDIGCVREDDAEEILQQMIDADLTLFASPTYFWGFTSQMKALMDRTWSFVINYKTPEHFSLIQGKKQALLGTGGSPYENNAEGLSFAFNKLQGFYKTTNAGELFIGKCAYDGTLPEDAQQRAQQFARDIVK